MGTTLLTKSPLQHPRDYSPVSWAEYFDEAHDIVLDDRAKISEHGVQVDGKESQQHQTESSFRVYMRNFKPPYAPTRTFGQHATGNENSSESEFNSYFQHPTIVTLHGGGYSSLTWAQFTRHIEQFCHCRILSIDLRGHGDTKTEDDDRLDIDTMVEDVINVIHAAHRLCGFIDTPKLILVGHSMGGAIAIKCSTRCGEFLPSLAGLVIIDVVEGTAKDALPLMMSVIKTRPIKFPTLKNAIEWTVRSGMTKNLNSARVSMPGNLLSISSGQLAIHDIDNKPNDDINRIVKHKFHINIENLIHHKNHTLNSLPRGLPLPQRVNQLKNSLCDVKMPKDIISGPAGVPPPLAIDPIREIPEDEEIQADENITSKPSIAQLDSDGYKKPPGLDESGYCWRTDLAKTQPHWPGWFEGLSQQLLDAPVQGKFLLLAGIDRLDKTLTIGQMQGKFSMKVLPKCGHAVHEDLPERVATEIGQFLIRNKFTTAI